MNRLKKLTFISFLCTLLSFSFLFAACSSETLKYQKLSDVCMVYALDTNISGDIVVPATYDGLEVMIADNAFRKCYKIKTITLSEGIRVIYELAFTQCSASEINVPHSIERFKNAPFAVNEYKNLTITYAGTIEEWYNVDGAPTSVYSGIQVVCTDGVAFDTRETAN